MKDLLIRTISGIAFIIIIIGAILWSPVSYVAIMCLILTGMMYEFLSISLKGSRMAGTILTIATGIAIFLFLFFINGYGMQPLYLILSLIPVLFIFISGLYVKEYNIHKEIRTPEGEIRMEDNGYERSPFLLSSLLYIAVPLSMCNLIVFDPEGNYSGTLLLSLFIILWAADVGAYCFGTLFGQKNGHRLFPSVSPKKSWEGFWGGLLCAILAGIILNYTGLLYITLLHSIILALLIGIFGVFGDLVESQLKRNFGVKDSGRIMPGHGGMLDRFDGALLAFPIAVIYLKFFIII